MLISVLRVFILYPLVVFSVRLMGKRQIGELQPTELVVTILISNIATLPLEDRNLPLLTGIVPMLLLICLEVMLSWAELKSRKLRHLLSGAPQVIIRGGKINQKIMEELRFSLDDLMTALRMQGIFDISDVQLAVVETNGTVSAYQKASARPVTCADLNLQPAEDDPPEILIADGSICEEGLRAAEISRKQLSGWMQHEKLRAEEIFLLTADRNGGCRLIKKEASV